jgi:hypothetical protein
MGFACDGVGTRTNFADEKVRAQPCCNESRSQFRPDAHQLTKQQSVSGRVLKLFS